MQKNVKSFDGTKINYDISRYSNKFLVFLHGAGGCLTAWAKERRFFSKKRISTIAIDLRGHGFSGRPDRVEDYNLENFAKDVYAVIKHEKIRDFIIVGHSFGGIITIMFHKLYSKLSKGYVLVDTFYKGPQTLKKIFAFNKALMHSLNNALSNGTDSNLVHPDYNNFVSTGDWNVSRIYSDIIHTGLKSWLFTFENFAKFNGIDILKSMNKHVLIIEGEDDSLSNVLVAKKIKNLIRKSSLDIIPKTNHIIVLNNPKILEKEIFNFASLFPKFLQK